MARGVDKITKRKEETLAQNKVKCECSCVSVLTPKTDYCICRWCGRKVYRTPQIKFKYEMKERLNK